MRAKFRTSVGHVGLVLTLLAGVLVIAFGTGYRASTAVLSDGSAWLVKGRTAAHVNGETGAVDATVGEAGAARDLASGRQRLQIVQTPTGGVYVVNKPTGQVTRIETATMQPGRPHQGTPGHVAVLAAGGHAYVADRKRGTVAEMDAKTMRPQGPPVALPGGVRSAVVDPGGAVWALSSDGAAAHRVADGALAGTVPIGGPDSRAALTLVGGRPVVVTGRGEVLLLGEREVERRLRAPIPPGARVELNDPAVPGSRLWIALPDAGQLAWVDLGSGRGGVTSLRAGGGETPGAPVVAAGRVYVPAHAQGLVVVLDAGSLKYLETIPVPRNAHDFDLFVKDDRVWINPPFEQRALVVAPDGTAKQVDKGTGHGIKGDHGEQGPTQERPRDTEQDRG